MWGRRGKGGCWETGGKGAILLRKAQFASSFHGKSYREPTLTYRGFRKKGGYTSEPIQHAARVGGSLHHGQRKLIHCAG